jgi:hypothetical protein
MKGLTIVKRTSKQEGTIRLRFRLRDGRGVDLYHKSDIDADLKDLDKFTDTGELKPRMSCSVFPSCTRRKSTMLVRRCTSMSNKRLL